MKKEKIILKKIEKLKSGNKKYEAIFDINGKIVKRKFGASGMSDFTKHKDKERRERYISRHKKDLKTNNPTRAGYLSMYILWNKPSFKASVADYKKKLNTYNRTGKFPTKITGSKILKFGTDIIPFNETTMKVLPPDIQTKIQKHVVEIASKNSNFGTIIPTNEETPSYLDRLPPELLQKIQESVSAYDIQSFYRKRLKTKSYLLSLLFYYWEVYDTTRNYGGYMQIKPWLVLDPLEGYTAHWLFLAGDILNAEDFSKGNFWYNCILHVVNEFIRFDPDNTNYDGVIRRNITVSEDNIEFIIEKMGGIIDFNEHQWYNRVYYWLTQEYDTENAFGKSKVPDNVKNKALYQRIKNKIRKEVDKKGRRWGAYDSGRLVREYKEKGGKYSGSKNKKEKSNLSRWYKEKWVDACSWPKRKSCGRTKSKEKIAYCRPSKKVDSKTPKLIQDLTKTQIKSRCTKKKKNPKKIIK